MHSILQSDLTATRSSNLYSPRFLLLCHHLLQQAVRATLKKPVCGSLRNLALHLDCFNVDIPVRLPKLLTPLTLQCLYTLVHCPCLVLLAMLRVSGVV